MKKVIIGVTIACLVVAVALLGWNADQTASRADHVRAEVHRLERETANATREIAANREEAKQLDERLFAAINAEQDVRNAGEALDAGIGIGSDVEESIVRLTAEAIDDGSQEDVHRRLDALLARLAAVRPDLERSLRDLQLAIDHLADRTQ